MIAKVCKIDNNEIRRNADGIPMRYIAKSMNMKRDSAIQILALINESVVPEFINLYNEKFNCCEFITVAGVSNAAIVKYISCNLFRNEYAKQWVDNFNSSSGLYEIEKKLNGREH